MSQRRRVKDVELRLKRNLVIAGETAVELFLETEKKRGVTLE